MQLAPVNFINDAARCHQHSMSYGILRPRASSVFLTLSETLSRQVPVESAAKHFGVSKHMVEGLQERTGWHAGMLAAFCDRMDDEAMDWTIMGRLILSVQVYRATAMGPPRSTHALAAGEQHVPQGIGKEPGVILAVTAG